MNELKESLPTQPQPYEVEKPLKNDILDQQLKVGQKAYELSVNNLSAVAITTFNLWSAIMYPDPKTLIATFIVTGNIYLKTYSSFKSQKNFDRLRTKSTIEDAEVGYRAMQLVYKGKEPLKQPGLTLHQGDNLFYLQLPKIDWPLQQDGSSENKFLVSDIYDYSLNRIREKMKGKNYKAVAIEMPNQKEAIPKAETKREKILSEKKGETIDPDTKCILVTPEEFEDLTLSQQEAFQKAAQALGDRTILDLLAQAKNAHTAEKRAKVTKLIEGRIDQILQREVLGYFNGPEVARLRTEAGAAPTRQVIHPYSFFRKTASGYFFVQSFTSSGELRMIPIQKLLETEAQPVAVIINSIGPHKRAQLAYLIHEYIKENGIEELVRERITDRGELLNLLKEEKGEVRKHEDLIKPKPWKKDLGSRIRPLLSMLMVYGVAQFGTPLILNQHLSKEITNPNALEQEAKVDKPIFTNTLPTPGLDWKIVPVGNMNPAGYWITSTSHEFKSGTWVINEEKEREIEVPTTIEDQSIPGLQIERVISLNQFSETRFKIPLRERTRLGALSIKDKDGNEIEEREINQLTDGTIEVVIANNPLKAKSSASIIATLLDSTDKDSRPHAPQRMQPIDESKLGQKAKREIEIVRNAKTVFGQNNDLADIIAQDHYYSLNPPNSEKLNNARQAEEYITALAETEGCSCDTCNTGYVLTSTLNTDYEAVNQAYGYIGVDKNPGGSSAAGGFLRTETRHAFGIGEGGLIYDATARKPTPPEDEITQKYFQMLAGATVDTAQAEESWKKSSSQIIQEADDKKSASDQLKILGGLLTTVAGAFTARQMGRFLKRVSPHIDPLQISDQITRKTFREDGIRQAFEFFSWLSYGNTERNPIKELGISQQAISLQTIRDNINYEKLAQYIKSPEVLEQRHGVGKAEAVKLRMLAKYLLST